VDALHDSFMHLPATILKLIKISLGNLRKDLVQRDRLAKVVARLSDLIETDQAIPRSLQIKVKLSVGTSDEAKAAEEDVARQFRAAEKNAATKVLQLRRGQLETIREKVKHHAQTFTDQLSSQLALPEDDVQAFPPTWIARLKDAASQQYLVSALDVILQHQEVTKTKERRRLQTEQRRRDLSATTDQLSTKELIMHQVTQEVQRQLSRQRTPRPQQEHQTPRKPASNRRQNKNASGKRGSSATGSPATGSSQRAKPTPRSKTRRPAQPRQQAAQSVPKNGQMRRRRDKSGTLRKPAMRPLRSNPPASA
jgi:hypothetical protein